MFNTGGKIARLPYEHNSREHRHPGVPPERPASVTPRRANKGHGLEMHVLINQSSGLQAQSKETWDSSLILHKQQILFNSAHSQEALGPQGRKVSSLPLLRTSVLVLKLRTSLLEETNVLSRREEPGTTRTTVLFLIPSRELVHLSWVFCLVLKTYWEAEEPVPICPAARQQDFTPVTVTALSPATR